MCVSKLIPIANLIDELFMEDVVLSYVIDDKNNISGIYLHHFNAKLDNESVVVTGGNNMEIITDLSNIKDSEFIRFENNITFTTKNGIKVELTII